jgi:arabinosaccharide transport system substrate-binding protein
VTKQTKYPVLAVDFLAYAKLSHEGAVAIWKDLRFDPARFEAWNDPELQAPDPYFGGEKVFNTLLQLRNEMPSPASETTKLSAAAQDIVINQVMYKALVEKSQTPAQALKAAADELRKQQ